MSVKHIHKPRIVCVGTNEESRTALTGLIEAGVNLVGLITRPARLQGTVCDYVDMHPMCAEAGITTIDTTDINSQSTHDQLHKLKPDYIYTLGWSQLFGSELLNLPTEYVVGSHPAPLPSGRGRAPVPWTILQRMKRSAVSLFVMDDKADSGPLLCQKWFDIPERPYAQEVYQLVAEALRDAFVSIAVAHATRSDLPAVPQNEHAISERAKRSPEDGQLDFNLPAKELECLVRAVSRPYPGAYSYYQDHKFTIWRADYNNVPDFLGLPGQILLRKENKLLVQCGDAPIWLSGFTAEGETVDARHFKIGAKFGYAVQDELFELRNRLSKLEAVIGMDPNRTGGRSAA